MGRTLGSVEVLNTESVCLTDLGKLRNIGHFSMHELRCCDHFARITAGEPTVCDRYRADILRKHWLSGASGIVTSPLPNSDHWWRAFNECYPDIAELLTHAIFVKRQMTARQYVLFETAWSRATTR
jgi:hypothetical protein